MSPWFWVAFVYGAQAVGAILVSRFFKVNSDDSWVPIGLLVFGAAAAILLGLRDRSKSLNQRLCWFPLILYALFIFSLSHRSFAGAELSFRGDYFHLVEFCTLALFLSCLWTPLLQRGRVFAFVGCVMASGLAFGVSDELHQAFVPGRDSNPLDVVWDAVGLSGGCIFYLAATRLHGMFLARLQKLPQKQAQRTE
jgi:hypothetical protein